MVVVMLLIFLKAAALTSIPFANIDDCKAAKSVLDSQLSKFSGDVEVVCLEKVAGKPAGE